MSLDKDKETAMSMAKAAASVPPDMDAETDKETAMSMAKAVTSIPPDTDRETAMSLAKAVTSIPPDKQIISSTIGQINIASNTVAVGQQTGSFIGPQFFQCTVENVVVNPLPVNIVEKKMFENQAEDTADEKIRKYLMKRQEMVCSNYNRFTPPIMQSRFEVDIAHMFTDLELVKESNDGKQESIPITLDEVLEIIKSKPACKVLIDGEGGIGKTTLLRYLAYNWSSKKSNNQTFEGKIVFLVSIRDIGEGEDFLEVITKQIKLKDFHRKTKLPKDSTIIQEFICNYDDEIVLMLDGLDELKTQSESPISLFKKEEFERSVVILTSRSENINEFIKESDVYVKVKGFSKQKMKEYIKKYFEPGLGESFVKELTRSKHSELYSMCRNPMLLLLICIMWEEKQEIPSDKADLFREIFRCILNQFNKQETKPKISIFEDIPKEYVNAMLLLGKCMYNGLKRNQLSIDKSDLVASDDMVAIALRLGFVYKDESFLKTDFQDIYAAPHKLIVESLVGFYFYKICENTDIGRSTDMLLDDKEWEEIRECKYLKNAREFAIGFLGVFAGKFLKNWITNSLSTYRSLTKYIKLVKQEHVHAVERSLIDHLANADLEIKQYIPDICKSLSMFIQQFNPVFDVENIFQLIRKVYQNKWNFCFKGFGKQMSSQEKGKFLAHILVALSNQKTVLEDVTAECNEKVVEYVIAEFEKFDIKFDVWDYTARDATTTPYLIYILTHSTELKSLHMNGQFFKDIMAVCSIRGIELKLQQLYIKGALSNIDGKSLTSLMYISPHLEELRMNNCNVTGDAINNMIRKCYSSGIRFKLDTLSIGDNNLSGIDGTSLALLMDLSPQLRKLHIKKCNLTGNVINDMITECSSREIKLRLAYLYISDNDLSNTNGALLSHLVDISRYLEMINCNLTGVLINDMVRHCYSRGVNKLQLEDLIISDNNISNIDGTLLASLMDISCQLEMLEMKNCNLTGIVINEMMREYSCRGITLQLQKLDVSGNNLSSIDSTSLASLLYISSCLRSLKLNNCNLTGTVINDMMRERSSTSRIKLELETLYISDNNLNNVDGISLACLLVISPHLELLDMHNCNLTGVMINDMMRECCSKGIMIRLHDLNISDNNLIDINATSLTALTNTFPRLNVLDIHNCNITGDVINDMHIEFSTRGIKFQLENLNISENNLSNINGTSLFSVFISPCLRVININNCSLTGVVVNDMIRECSNQRIKLKLRDLFMSGNNFSNIDGTSLASLIDISRDLLRLDMQHCNLKSIVINDMIRECSNRSIKLSLGGLYISDNNLSNIGGSLAFLSQLVQLDMRNCNLTGLLINDIIRVCCARGIKLDLDYLIIRDNNLSDMDGSSLASLLDISHSLSKLDLHNCNLTGVVVNDMMRECCSKGIEVGLVGLDISDNNLIDINATSLICTFPRLNILMIHNCNITGDVINDMERECSSRGIKLELGKSEYQRMY